MIRPCLNCKCRTPECHAYCGAYKIYKGVTDYRNGQAQEQRTKEYEAVTSIIDSMSRHKIKGY